jgi:hypothetical protein
MITTTTTFTSTEGTSSSTSTRNCDYSCDCWTTVCLYEGTVAGCDYNAPRSVFSKSLYADPEEPIEDDIFPDPIDREALKLWRKLAKQKPQYRSKFILKPHIKRRILNSKSGWLARVGRKKKRGK